MELKEDKSLQDYDLSISNITIQAIITYLYNSNSEQKEKNIQKINNKDNFTNCVNNKNINTKNNDSVPIELIPKLTKVGYKCEPSITELSRMTTEELKRVNNFKIYNEHGQVLFKEPINLLGVNLDKEIIIEKNLIDTGDKLNYWSQYKLYNFKIEKENLNIYKQNMEKEGGKLIGYNNNILEWEYKKIN